jgi:hypothetical protein
MKVRLVVSPDKIQYSSHQILHFRCCKCRDAKPFAQTEDLEHDPFPFVRACSQGSTARWARLPWGILAFLVNARIPPKARWCFLLR